MAKYCPYKEGPALYPECMECKEKICGYFFCMVIGSRTFNDYDFLKQKLDFFLSKAGNDIVIVSGGAKGTDTLAEQYAKEKGYILKVFPADWDKYGKSAGYIRNREMHEYLSKQERKGVVAFWDGKSKGTAQSFDLVREYCNPIRIIKI